MFQLVSLLLCSGSSCTVLEFVLTEKCQNKNIGEHYGMEDQPEGVVYLKAERLRPLNQVRRLSSRRCHSLYPFRRVEPWLARI